jgi:hypothetical protein
MPVIVEIAVDPIGTSSPSVGDYIRKVVEVLKKRGLKQIIKEQGLPFKRADQEVQVKTVVGKIKYPDIVIWNGTGEKVACLIELKTPIISTYDEELVEDALKKSSDAGIPFFVTQLKW